MIGRRFARSSVRARRPSNSAVLSESAEARPHTVTPPLERGLAGPTLGRTNPQEPRTRPGRRPRSGLLLAVAIVLLVILLLLGSTRLFVSSQQLDTAVRLADHERAYQLASSALTVAMRQIDRLIAFVADPDPATYPKADKIPVEIQGLAGALLDRQGLLKTTGGTAELASPYLALLAGLPDVESLTVRVILEKSRPLFEAKELGGIVPDPLETTALVTLKAEAEAGKSRGRAIAFLEMRQIDISPPVLGKFVLWLRQQGDLVLDGVADSSRRDRIGGLPLVVRGGQAAPPGSLAPDRAAELLDRQGWILLGGDRSWTLPLARGGGLPEFEAGILQPGAYAYDLEPGSFLEGRGDIGYYARQTPMFAELATAEEDGALALKGQDVCGKAGLLSLHGSTAYPTPTLVLGKVVRRWALLQGLENRDTGKSAPLPFLDAATFPAQRWPGRASPSTLAAVRQQFGDDFARYALRMSDLVEEPYNAGNLAVLDLGSEALKRVMVLEPSRLPAGAPRPPPSARLSLDGVPVGFHEMAEGGRFTLKDDAGRELYDGGPPEAMADLAFLRQKAGRRYATGADFLRDCKGPQRGDLIVPGAVQVAGDLVLDQPVTVKSGGGGLVLVDGEIRIRQGVSVESNEPLSLIALGGDVRVETAAPVRAGLIALAGRVRLPKSFDIRGLVAAGSLTVEASREDGIRQLEYEPAFDPTDAAARRRRLRLTTPKRWQMYVP